jgi:hypothetical protein
MKGLSENPIARKAMTAINHQRARCNNPKHPYYKYYGAKGIRVEYDTREFIGWYIEEYKTFEGTDPTIGRIDHSKSYTLDNIRFESREDNSLESIHRNGKFKNVWKAQQKEVYIIEVKTKRCVARVDSIKEASNITGQSIGCVSRHINKRCEKPWAKYTFTTRPRRVDNSITIVKKVNRHIVILNAKTLKPIKTVKTAKQAKAITGVHPSHIPKYCSGYLKQSKHGYTFRYETLDTKG